MLAKEAPSASGTLASADELRVPAPRALHGSSHHRERRSGTDLSANVSNGGTSLASGAGAGGSTSRHSNGYGKIGASFPSQDPASMNSAFEVSLPARSHLDRNTLSAIAEDTNFTRIYAARVLSKIGVSPSRANMKLVEQAIEPEDFRMSSTVERRPLSRSGNRHLVRIGLADMDGFGGNGSSSSSSSSGPGSSFLGSRLRHRHAVSYSRGDLYPEEASAASGSGAAAGGNGVPLSPSAAAAAVAGGSHADDGQEEEHLHHHVHHHQFQLHQFHDQQSSDPDRLADSRQLQADDSSMGPAASGAAGSGGGGRAGAASPVATVGAASAPIRKEVLTIQKIARELSIDPTCSVTELLLRLGLDRNDPLSLSLVQFVLHAARTCARLFLDLSSPLAEDLAYLPEGHPGYDFEVADAVAMFNAIRLQHLRRGDMPASASAARQDDLLVGDELPSEPLQHLPQDQEQLLRQQQQLFVEFVKDCFDMIGAFEAYKDHKQLKTLFQQTWSGVEHVLSSSFPSWVSGNVGAQQQLRKCRSFLSSLICNQTSGNSVGGKGSSSPAGRNLSAVSLHRMSSSASPSAPASSSGFLSPWMKHQATSALNPNAVTSGGSAGPTATSELMRLLLIADPSSSVQVRKFVAPHYQPLPQDGSSNSAAATDFGIQGLSNAELASMSYLERVVGRCLSQEGRRELLRLISQHRSEHCSHAAGQRAYLQIGRDRERLQRDSAVLLSRRKSRLAQKYEGDSVRSARAASSMSFGPVAASASTPAGSTNIGAAVAGRASSALSSPSTSPLPSGVRGQLSPSSVSTLDGQKTSPGMQRQPRRAAERRRHRSAGFVSTLDYERDYVEVMKMVNEWTSGIPKRGGSSLGLSASTAASSSAVSPAGGGSAVMPAARGSAGTGRPPPSSGSGISSALE